MNFSKEETVLLINSLTEYRRAEENNRSRSGQGWYESENEILAMRKKLETYLKYRFLVV